MGRQEEEEEGRIKAMDVARQREKSSRRRGGVCLIMVDEEVWEAGVG